MKSNQNSHLINFKLILIDKTWSDPLCSWAMVIQNCLYDNFWSGGPIMAHDIPLWLLEHQDFFVSQIWSTNYWNYNHAPGEKLLFCP